MVKIKSERRIPTAIGASWPGVVSVEGWRTGNLRGVEAGEAQNFKVTRQRSGEGSRVASFHIRTIAIMIHGGMRFDLERRDSRI